MSFEIDFEPSGQRCSGSTGETVLTAAQHAGVLLTAVCGGNGLCGRCKAQVIAGQVSPPTVIEQSELSPLDLEAGWRLACQAEIRGDVRVHIPPDSLVSSQRIQTEGKCPPLEPDPMIRAITLELPHPSLNDLRSDADRIRDTLDCPRLTFCPSVLRTLSSDIRAAHFQPTVVLREQTVVAVRALHTPSIGLAVDIGTTKIAAYLVDLDSGETIAAGGKLNPQIMYGEDVMARIHYAMTDTEVGVGNGREELRTAVVNAVNQLASELCARSAHSTGDILDVVVVGNTAMGHLFLGLPVTQLGLAPYVAVENAPLNLPCREVGLDLAPGAFVYLPPNIAGFVGADHVAMLLASRLPDHGAAVLALDIGTNTEISLLAHGQHLVCSTASGPAFEGAHIRCGMRAAPGAIEKVTIHDGRVYYTTIADQPPVGLCGSGILDLMAELRRAGILNQRGAFTHLDDNPRIRTGEHGREYVVIPAAENRDAEITFNREDVKEIQLAKGAIRAGVQILLQQAGLDENELEAVILAGAFGTYLDVQNGIEIGMFPRIDPHRYIQIGNAAGAGARMALLSIKERERAAAIARQVRYVELTTQEDFPFTFAKAMWLA
jgi:uncharacterized 2Fe-2S/4Fe-4S cluster protein (DUF4445 family)